MQTRRFDLATPVNQAPAPAVGRDPAVERDRARIDHLLRDPSLRSTDTGRAPPRRLPAGAAETAQWDRLAEAAPARCADAVAALALVNARAWRDFAVLVAESRGARRTRPRAAGSPDHCARPARAGARPPV